MKLKPLIIATLPLIAYNTFAESLWPIDQTKRAAPVVTLSLGPAMNTGIDSETLALQPDVVKTYKVSRNVNTFGTGELFVGMQTPMFHKNLLGQLGIAVAYANQVPLTGDIWEDADPDFNNYTYKYKVNHARIALKAKLSTDINTVVQPYISGSIGVGQNKAGSFTISPKIYEEVPAPNFTTGTDSGSVYTLGLGLQTTYNSNWQYGIGYEFADLGRTVLGKAPGQTTNEGISGKKLYTNEIQFSLSYIFSEGPYRI